MRCGGQQVVGEAFLKPVVNPKAGWMLSSISVLDITDFQRTGRKRSQESEFHLKPIKCGETRTDGFFWSFWDGGESMSDILPLTPVGVPTFRILQQ